MVRARWRWRGSRCVARVRSSALFLAAHKHRLARVLCVVCCVFWFFSRVCALFCPVSQHTAVGPSFMLVDARLSAPHHPSPSPPHPLLAPHLSLPVTVPSLPVTITALCCVFGPLGPPWTLFHPISQHTGGVSRLPWGIWQVLCCVFGEFRVK